MFNNIFCAALSAAGPPLALSKQCPGLQRGTSSADTGPDWPGSETQLRECVAEGRGSRDHACGMVVNVIEGRYPFAGDGLEINIIEKRVENQKCAALRSVRYPWERPTGCRQTISFHNGACLGHYPVSVSDHQFVCHRFDAGSFQKRTFSRTLAFYIRHAPVRTICVIVAETIAHSLFSLCPPLSRPCVNMPHAHQYWERSPWTLSHCRVFSHSTQVPHAMQDFGSRNLRHISLSRRNGFHCSSSL